MLAESWELMEPIRAVARGHAQLWDECVDAALAGAPVTGPGSIRVRVRTGMLVVKSKSGLVLFGTSRSQSTMEVEIETQVGRAAPDGILSEIEQYRPAELGDEQIELFKRRLLELAEPGWDVPPPESRWNTRWIRLMRRVLAAHGWSEATACPKGTIPDLARLAFIQGIGA